MELISIEVVEASTPPPIIPGRLVRGLNLWTGPTGARKTTAALEAALTICRINDRPFADKLPTLHGPVIYLGAEESVYSLKSKVHPTLFPPMPPNVVGDRFFCVEDAWRYPLDNPKHMKELLHTASYLDTRLIIIDPYANFLDIADENDQHTARMIAGPLHEWAHGNGAAVLILHHCRKKPAGDLTLYTWDDIRGASALVSAADGKIIFQRQNSETGEVPLTIMFRDFPSPEGLTWLPSLI